MVTSLKGEANFCEILNWQFCLEMNEGLYFLSGEIFFAPIIWDSFDRIIPLEKAGQGGQMIEDLSTKDEVSDLGYNWVAQGPDFKSALSVVKMFLNTQCYQYLWLSMWFHAKKSKETLKTQNLWFYNVNSAPEPRNDQKSPKKRITKSRFTQFFV